MCRPPPRSDMSMIDVGAHIRLLDPWLCVLNQCSASSQRSHLALETAAVSAALHVCGM